MGPMNVVILLLLQALLGTVRTTECPDYWTSFDGSCYLFPDHHQMPFADAEEFCQNNHMSNLVHIDNAAENSFIKTYLQKMKDEPHWMDLTDQDHEGEYFWNDTGSPIEFTDWAPGQPDNYIGGDEDCILFYDDDNYLWHDAPCEHSHEPICEKNCIVAASSPIQAFLEFLLPVLRTIFFPSHWLLSHITNRRNNDQQ